MEEWKDVVGFEGYYQVSNTGRVRSLDRFVNHPKGGLKKIKGRECSYRKNAARYPEVCLFKQGVKKYALVHRLVALAFIDNPYNKPEVNHKDGVKTNNLVSNLEWCSSSENQQHAYANKLQVGKKGKDHPNYGKRGSICHKAKSGKIRMPCGDILVFKAQSELCAGFDLQPAHVSSVLFGKRPRHKGWTKV